MGRKHKTIDELERELSELERELAAIEEAPPPAETPATPKPARSLPRMPRLRGKQEPDATPERERPQGEPDTASKPARQRRLGLPLRRGKTQPDEPRSDGERGPERPQDATPPRKKRRFAFPGRRAKEAPEPLPEWTPPPAEAPSEPAAAEPAPDAVRQRPPPEGETPVEPAPSKRRLPALKLPRRRRKEALEPTPPVDGPPAETAEPPPEEPGPRRRRTVVAVVLLLILIIVAIAIYGALGGQEEALVVQAVATQLPDGTLAAVTGQEVLFSARGPQGVTWDFGDGNTGTGPEVRHAYDTAGRYTVAATGNGATATLMLTVYRTPELQVTVLFNGTEATLRGPGDNPVYAGEQATLRGQATVDPDLTVATVAWSQDDETFGLGQSVAFTPQTPGRYRITATLTDSVGNQARANLTLHASLRVLHDGAVPAGAPVPAPPIPPPVPLPAPPGTTNQTHPVEVPVGRLAVRPALLAVRVTWDPGQTMHELALNVTGPDGAARPGQGGAGELTLEIPVPTPGTWSVVVDHAAPGGETPYRVEIVAYY